MKPSFSPLLDQLIDAFQCLPGIGPKSAQRMAFYLLERHRDAGFRLAEKLNEALEHIQHCTLCRTFSETTHCRLCQQTHRNPKQLCLVENPIDVLAIEQSHSFHGFYFVLMGHLSPIDGIGPEALGIEQLLQRFDKRIVEELIIATNPTVEGEATAHYIANLAKDYGMKVTRIAHGVPLGGELEYIDSSTLAKAIEQRDTF